MSLEEMHNCIKHRIAQEVLLQKLHIKQGNNEAASNLADFIDGMCLILSIVETKMQLPLTPHPLLKR